MLFEVQVHDSEAEHKNAQMRMTFLKVLKEINPYPAVRKHAKLSGLLPEHSL